ncbi:MAG: hypothetical protein V3S38_00555 [Acidimicrobiia bacterium]
MSTRELRNNPIAQVTLTDAATVVWDVGAAPTATVTLTDNRTMGAPTGQIAGSTYVLRVVQDGTGSRTLAWNALYVFEANAVPILTLSAAGVNTFIFVSDGTNLHLINPSRRAFAPRGYIDGLIMSNDSDADHDIAVSNGECSLITETSLETNVLAKLSSTLVKRGDADWADGTGNGGIASGANTSDNELNADTWYHFFLIAKTDGTLDAGFDTSVTAANLLADATAYTFHRRIGSILSDGSTPPNIIKFFQYGDMFIWDSNPNTLAAEVIATGGETHPLTVPTGFNMLVNISLYTTQAANANSLFIVTTPDMTDDEPDLTAVPGASYGVIDNRSGPQTLMVTTDTAASVRIQVLQEMTLELWTNFWIDPRGRAMV